MSSSVRHCLDDFWAAGLDGGCVTSRFCSGLTLFWICLRIIGTIAFSLIFSLLEIKNIK